MGKNLRGAILKAVRNKVKAGEMTFVQALAVRIATLDKDTLVKIEAEMIAALVDMNELDEKVIPSAIDWEQLFRLIELLLPLILKLIGI